MDIAVGDAPPNRVVFELFADIVPKTVEKCAGCWMLSPCYTD
jgi:hypothetical protein